MAYARLDDRFSGNRKVKRALRREPAAVAFHVMAIAYCCQHETDGVIDAEEVQDWLAMLPYRPAQRDRVVPVMIEVGLLERVDDDHYRVANFLDWNESAEQREQIRAAGRAGAEARWGRRRRRGTTNADADANRIGDANPNPNSSPHHTTPTPQKPPTPPQAGEPEIRDLPLPDNDPSSRPPFDPPQPAPGRTRNSEKYRAAYSAWRADLTAWLQANPPIALEASWSALRSEAADRVDDIAAIYLDHLHAHHLDDGLVVLGVSQDALSMHEAIESSKAVRAVATATGRTVRVIDCGCQVRSVVAA